jgi:uncharacterized membrane protein
MKKGRLEAFSDGVIAIIITIMVLELKVPAGDIHSGDLEALRPMLPVFLSYLLSFVYVGIYWNNHHHMFYLVETITGGALWANLNLLFWLSLVPFATAWMGDNHFSQWPVIVYGLLLIMCSIAYFILARILASHCAKNSELAEAIGNDWKGKASTVIYALGIGLAFIKPYLGYSTYIVVAIIWFIPDRRIEKRVIQPNPSPGERGF